MYQGWVTSGNSINTVPKAILGDYTELLWFIYDFRRAGSVRNVKLCSATMSGETYHPFDNKDSWRIYFWTPVMIWDIFGILLSFLALTELVVHLFLFARKLVHNGSSVILFIVLFDSVGHSAS